MEPSHAARRATLFGLHTGAVFAGVECALVWLAFGWAPAAIVGGVACALGGLLALLAYPRTWPRTPRAILLRGAGAHVYGVALIALGALLLRGGLRA